MVSVPARRQQVAYARLRGVSCRRACGLVHVARSALRYESKMDNKDRAVVARLCELAARYPRWGYRRIRVMLRFPASTEANPFTGRPSFAVGMICRLAPPAGVAGGRL